MNKKFVSAAVAVLLGIAAFVMISSTVSLVFDAILAQDVTKLTSVSEAMGSVISYMQGTAIGLAVFTAAAIASYCFTYFTKAKKIFGCISAGVSLAVASFCIAFVFDLRAIVLESSSETAYSAAAGYFGELILLASAALLLCACFTVVAVKAFTARTEAEPEAVPAAVEEANDETN